MKQRIAKAFLLCFALSCLTGVGYVFADDVTVNLESKAVALSPEKDLAGNALYGTWEVMGSKFATPGFPIKTDVKTYPVAVYGSGSQSQELKSLGVAMLFDRKEYNWVDIYPVKKGDGDKMLPDELPLPGRVKMIDMWVWSGNYDYYLEAFVRDYKGIVHTITMGDLNFAGWKNLRINVPDNIPQSKKYLPRRESMTLVKFRIWTRPTEIVAALEPIVGELDPKLDPKNEGDLKKIREFYMPRTIKFYFHNIKVLTDTFETLFDGDTLTRPEVVKEAWGSFGSGN